MHQILGIQSKASLSLNLLLNFPQFLLQHLPLGLLNRLDQIHNLLDQLLGLLKHPYLSQGPLSLLDHHQVLLLGLLDHHQVQLQGLLSHLDHHQVQFQGLLSHLDHHQVQFQGLLSPLDHHQALLQGPLSLLGHPDHNYLLG